MPVVARLDQYSATLSREFDEVTLNSVKMTDIGTYYSQGFNENVGITTTLTSNIFKPYDPLNDLVAEVPFGVGQGTYMRQNNDKNVDVYDEIDEVTLYGMYVKKGLVLNLDAGTTLSYSGVGTQSAWIDISPTKTTASLASTTTSYPTYSTDNFGNFTLNGSSHYVQVNSSVLPITTSFTISVIFKFTSPTGTKYIFDNRDSGNDGFSLKISNQSLTCDLNSISTTIGISNNLNTGQIYFIDFVVDGSGGRTKINSYLNGTFNDGPSTSPTLSFNTTVSPRIGATSYSPITNFFGGTIYSVKLYNRALTSDEIKQNFNILKGIYNL
jgi:hypothetical protein